MPSADAKRKRLLLFAGAAGVLLVLYLLHRSRAASATAAPTAASTDSSGSGDSGGYGASGAGGYGGYSADSSIPPDPMAAISAAWEQGYSAGVAAPPTAAAAATVAPPATVAAADPATRSLAIVIGSYGQPLIDYTGTVPGALSPSGLTPPPNPGPTGDQAYDIANQKAADAARIAYNEGVAATARPNAEKHPRQATHAGAAAIATRQARNNAAALSIQTRTTNLHAERASRENAAAAAQEPAAEQRRAQTEAQVSKARSAAAPPPRAIAWRAAELTFAGAPPPRGFAGAPPSAPPTDPSRITKGRLIAV